MNNFDVFWFDENGTIWIGAVDTLETAKAHIEALEKSGKRPQAKLGRYEVIDRRTGETLYQSIHHAD
jgi:hypothetical protein